MPTNNPSEKTQPAVRPNTPTNAEIKDLEEKINNLKKEMNTFAEIQRAPDINPPVGLTELEKSLSNLKSRCTGLFSLKDPVARQRALNEAIQERERIEKINQPSPENKTIETNEQTKKTAATWAKDTGQPVDYMLKLIVAAEIKKHEDLKDTLSEAKKSAENSDKEQKKTYENYEKNKQELKKLQRKLVVAQSQEIRKNAFENAIAAASDLPGYEGVCPSGIKQVDQNYYEYSPATDTDVAKFFLRLAKNPSLDGLEFGPQTLIGKKAFFKIENGTCETLEGCPTDLANAFENEKKSLEQEEAQDYEENPDDLEEAQDYVSSAYSSAYQSSAYSDDVANPSDLEGESLGDLEAEVEYDVSYEQYKKNLDALRQQAKIDNLQARREDLLVLQNQPKVENTAEISAAQQKITDLEKAKSALENVSGFTIKKTKGSGSFLENNIPARAGLQIKKINEAYKKIGVPLDSTALENKQKELKQKCTNLANIKNLSNKSEEESKLERTLEKNIEKLKKEFTQKVNDTITKLNTALSEQKNQIQQYQDAMDSDKKLREERGEELTAIDRKIGAKKAIVNKDTTDYVGLKVKDMVIAQINMAVDKALLATQEDGQSVYADKKLITAKVTIKHSDTGAINVTLSSSTLINPKTETEVKDAVNFYMKLRANYLQNNSKTQFKICQITFEGREKPIFIITEDGNFNFKVDACPPKLKEALNEAMLNESIPILTQKAHKLEEQIKTIESSEIQTITGLEDLEKSLQTLQESKNKDPATQKLILRMVILERQAIMESNKSLLVDSSFEISQPNTLDQLILTELNNDSKDIAPGFLDNEIEKQTLLLDTLKAKAVEIKKNNPEQFLYKTHKDARLDLIQLQKNRFILEEQKPSPKHAATTLLAFYPYSLRLAKTELAEQQKNMQYLETLEKSLSSPAENSTATWKQICIDKKTQVEAKKKDTLLKLNTAKENVTLQEKAVATFAQIRQAVHKTLFAVDEHGRSIYTNLEVITSEMKLDWNKDKARPELKLSNQLTNPDETTQEIDDAVNFYITLQQNITQDALDIMDDKNNIICTITNQNIEFTDPDSALANAIFNAMPEDLSNFSMASEESLDIDPDLFPHKTPGTAEGAQQPPFNMDPLNDLFRVTTPVTAEDAKKPPFGIDPLTTPGTAEGAQQPPEFSTDSFDELFSEKPQSPLNATTPGAEENTNDETRFVNYKVEIQGQSLKKEVKMKILERIRALNTEDDKINVERESETVFSILGNKKEVEQTLQTLSQDADIELTVVDEETKKTFSISPWSMVQGPYCAEPEEDEEPAATATAETEDEELAAATTAPAPATAPATAATTTATAEKTTEVTSQPKDSTTAFTPPAEPKIQEFFTKFNAAHTEAEAKFSDLQEDKKSFKVTANSDDNLHLCIKELSKDPMYQDQILIMRNPTTNDVICGYIGGAKATAEQLQAATTPPSPSSSTPGPSSQPMTPTEDTKGRLNLLKSKSQDQAQDQDQDPQKKSASDPAQEDAKTPGSSFP